MLRNIFWKFDTFLSESFDKYKVKEQHLKSEKEIILNLINLKHSCWMKVFISIKNVNTDPRLLNSSVCAEGPDVQLPLSVSERAAWEFKGPWQSEALASSIIQHCFLSFSPSVFNSSNPLAIWTLSKWNWNVLLTHRQDKKQGNARKGIIPF